MSADKISSSQKGIDHFSSSNSSTSSISVSTMNPVGLQDVLDVGSETAKTPLLQREVGTTLPKGRLAEFCPRNEVGDKCREQGDHVKAAQTYYQAGDAYMAEKNEVWAGEMYANAGDQYIDAKDLISAAKVYRQAGDAYRTGGAHREAGPAYKFSGKQYKEIGDSKLANEMYKLGGHEYMSSGHEYTSTGEDELAGDTAPTKDISAVISKIVEQ